MIALISEKNKTRKKRQNRKVGMKPWLKRRKNVRFYESLHAELGLEDECDYENYLRMTSENISEIFQLIKDGITKENTNMRDPLTLRFSL